MLHRIKILAAMDQVKLSPQQSEGNLVIVKALENHKEVISLVWTLKPSKQVEAMADDWQSVTNEGAIRNKNKPEMKPMPLNLSCDMLLNIEEGDLVLPMESIKSISTDETSKSLIVGTSNFATYVFQFINASPTQALSLISMAIEGSGKLLGEQKRSDEWDLDLGLKLLDTFGQVKNFYMDTASGVLNNVLTLFGGSKRTVVDGEESEGGLRNPWIIDKRIELPSSRFTGKQLNDIFLTSFLRPDGSVPNWDTLLKVVHFTGLDSSIRRFIWLGIF